MSKLVILDLYAKGVEDVIQVFVEVGQEGKIYEKRSDGVLENDPRLWQAFDTWQTHYRSLAGPYRAIKLKAVHREGRFEFQKQKVTTQA